MSEEDSAPLAGVTVIDLTRVLAGPYCTMVLSDLGARVIKVEVPGSGDDSRSIGPFMADGRSAYFMSLNRGKESIALDLKAPDDRAMFLDLLAGADVLVENYRGGTMEKLGLGWDVLEPQFPRLIYAAVSGFGHSGPYMKRAAYDMVVQAMGGVMSLTGHPGGPPTRVGSSIGDITAGMFLTVGVNAALFRRSRTGRGGKIDVSMLDSQVAILENAIARYVTTGQVPGPLGARHPSITPFEAFATADGHIVIAAGNDGLFRRLAETIGRADLAAQPDYANNNARTDNQIALKREIERALQAAGTAEWLQRLDAAGIPSGPINTVDAVMQDPQVLARNMVVTADDGSGGQIRMAGNPVKFSDVPDPTTRGRTPGLDEHGAAIRAEFGRSRR